MVKRFSSDGKYLETYYLEDYQEEMHEMDMHWAKDLDRQECKAETAKAMLKKGFDTSLISELTGLSVKSINSIIL